MGKWSIVAYCVATAVAIGCSSDARSPATPSPSIPPLLAGTLTALASSPTPRPSPLPSATPDLSPPFAIEQPVDSSALPPPEESSSTWYRVLDLDTGRAQLIRVDTDRLPALPDYSTPLNIGWLDDDTLAITTAAGTYRARLDGSVSPALGAAPTPLPQPAPDWPSASADGTWSANYGVSAGIVIGPPGGAPHFRLVNTYTPQWAPIGHLIAFVGDVCAGMHLFVFDPGDGALRNLTAAFNELALDFVWRPDASAIAFFSFGTDGGVDRRSIELIDVRNGEHQTLVDMRGAGETIPLAWSPGGKHLLYLTRSTGRGFCDSGGVPTPQPTRLELLP